MAEALSTKGGDEFDLVKRVRGGATSVMVLGAALLALGVAALVFPMAATLAGTLFVGWMLIFNGAIGVWGAFSMSRAGPFFGALLFGLLSLAAGVFMLVSPLAGELAITLALGTLFMVQGASELWLAFELRPARNWDWMLFSAIASIVLAILIIAGWPNTSLVTVGALIGVNFISSGLGYLMLGAAVRHLAPKS